MFQWVYDLASGEFLSGGPCEVSYNGLTQGVVKLLRNPDQRKERFDSKDGIRPATTQEVSAYDMARAADAEQGQFDGQKMLKAVAIYFAQKMGIPLQTAKADVLTIYRGL